VADPITTISPAALVIAFVPAAVVLGIHWRWSCGFGTSAYGLARMVIQLILIGYVLNFIFNSSHAAITATILGLMLTIAAWIAMRPIGRRRPRVYAEVLLSISLAGVSTLFLVTRFVIDAEPWYEPRIVIPLAGMIFAGGMNAVSLAAERYAAERSRGTAYEQARRIALSAALIPLINALFAVGLVSLPGMMTGQILAGVSPLVAARYQIVVMCMLFGSSGVAAACYLVLAHRRERTASA